MLKPGGKKFHSIDWCNNHRSSVRIFLIYQLFHGSSDFWNNLVNCHLLSSDVCLGSKDSATCQKVKRMKNQKVKRMKNHMSDHAWCSDPIIMTTIACSISPRLCIAD